MPFFKSLTSFPQQFAMNGSVYLINPGEIVELPEDFVGRYAGLIDQVHPIFVKKPEISESVPPQEILPSPDTVETVEPPVIVEETDVVLVDDSEEDDVAVAVKNANVFISPGVIVKTEQEVAKEDVPVKAQKIVKPKPKSAKKGK